MPSQSLFTADWPRYAVAAQVLFWGASASFLAGCIGGYAGLIGGQSIIWLFWLAIVSAFLLGVAAACSGKLYRGDQVFSRSPMTGWAARTMGVVVAVSAACLMLFATSLTQLVGR